MPKLPTGTITFLLTDVEGSTRLWAEHPEAMRRALARHDHLVEEHVEGNNGVLIKPRGEGDSRFAAFARARDAVACACAIQRALCAEPWPTPSPIRVRVALHTGETELRDGDYYGPAVNLCARLRSAASGGQVLLTSAVETLVKDSLPEGARLRDLGEHRLRDIHRGERVYQLLHPSLPDSFPSLRSLDASRHNLPLQPTSFVGRESELARIAELLQFTRLLTLTGPGGVGKTRLALEAAASLLDQFEDGAFFISLMSIADPALVVPSIAQAVGVKEIAGRSIAESIQAELRDRELLLVLDNFEQVAEAALLVAWLLASCPHLKVVVTSRVVLHLSGEHEYAVQPLALPDRKTVPSASQLACNDAIRLFVARAQAARADFALMDANAPGVAELCRRLDGLPLAIELAAARLRALPLPALLARMERRLPLLTGGPRDAPARQQTLRSAIAWSYDLLDAPEQALFRRLAVFRGGTLDTIEAVCCAPEGGPGSTSIALPPLALDALDGVASLVEKSLVRQEEMDDGQPWYVMHEHIREYALERLAECGEVDAVRRRHVLSYLKLAEAAESDLAGPREGASLDRLEQEHGNLRDALAWCLERGYAEPAVRLVEALWWFWLRRGHVGEGRSRLADLLARFPLSGATDKHLDRYARALRVAGLLALAQGDRVATAMHEQSLGLRRRLGDPVGIYNSLDAAGMSAYVVGDHPAARAYLEEALAIARAQDDPEMIAWGLQNLATVVDVLGDHARARALLEESLALQRSLGLPGTVVGGALYSLAVVANQLAEHDLARRLASDSVDLYRQHGHRRLGSMAFTTLGSIATAQGDFSAANEYLGASLAIHQEMGDLVGVASVLESYAELAAARGMPARTIRLAGAASALREQVGVPLLGDGLARLEGILRPAREALGRRSSDEAMAAGRALSLDEAIAEALSPVESATAVGQPDDREATALTRREREVASLIARGYTNRHIAAELCITEGTAANHVVHILDKLGYEARSQIAVWAAEHGLLTDCQAEQSDRTGSRPSTRRTA